MSFHFELKEVIIHPAVGSAVKILSPGHPAKIRGPSEDFATCHTRQIDFEAYLAEFEAFTCTKFNTRP